MTKKNLRKKLAARGYGLVSVRDGYGIEGFLVTEAWNNTIIGGSDLAPLTLEEAAAYLEN